MHEDKILEGLARERTHKGEGGEDIMTRERYKVMRDVNLKFMKIQ